MDLDIPVSEEQRQKMKDFMKTINTKSEVAYLFDLGELKLNEIEYQSNSVKHDEVDLSTLSDKNYSNAPGQEGVSSWYNENSRDLNMAKPPYVENDTVEGAHEAKCQIRVDQRVPEGIRSANESYLTQDCIGTVRATPRDTSVCGPGSGRHRVVPPVEPRQGGVAQVERCSTYEPPRSEQRDEEQDLGRVSFRTGDDQQRIQAALHPAPTVIKEVPVSHDSDRPVSEMEIEKIIKSSYHKNIHPLKSDRPVNSVTCNVCKETFSFKSNLRRHMQTQHVDQIRKFACEICGTQYTRLHNLTKHKNSSHSGKFISCTNCPRQFRHESGLKTHMEECKKQNCEKGPPNQSVYKCDLCQKCFWNEHNLYKHKQTHTKPGDKPFQCCKCGKRFSYNGRKSAHEVKCEVIKSASLLPSHAGLERPLFHRDPPPHHQHQQQSPPVGYRLNSEIRMQDESASSVLLENQKGALPDNQFSTQENITSTHWGCDVPYQQYNRNNSFNYNGNVSYYNSGNIASGQHFSMPYENMQQGYYASRPDYYNTNVYMSEHYPHGVNACGGEGLQ